MTTNRILQLLPMAATCLWFTSCIDSSVPLSDPNASKADERLAGNWRLRNDDGSVNSYRFTEGTEPKVKLVEEKGWTAETINTYWIYRYQITGDVLTMQGIWVDAKSEAIKAGKIKGVIEKDQQGNPKICFTDTTENLVKFVVEAGDDLFRKDVVRLERMK